MRNAFIVLACCAFAACKSGYKLVGENNQKSPENLDPKSAAGAPVMVYKTKGDFRNLVPVMLSDDGKRIVSYPDPKDIKTENGYQTPTELHKGYLLDNRGITPTVAFLKYSYEEYAALTSLPTLAEMYGAIQVKNPLTELYDCGSQTVRKNRADEINELIDKGELRSKCKTLR